MKVRRRLFYWAVSLCLCCSLLFCSAVSVGAAWGISVPEYAPYKRGSITTTEFLNAPIKTAATRIYSSTQGSLVYSLDPIHQVVGSRMCSGGYMLSEYRSSGMLQWSIPVDDNIYGIYAVETFVGFEEFTEIDTNKYDIFFERQGFAMEIPKDYTSSVMPISFWITPYFLKSDGSLVAGTYFATTEFTTREFGESMVYLVYSSPDDCFAIAREDIPEDWSFYGVGYRWDVPSTFPEGTHFYISQLDYALYEPSNATSAAIENMSDQISEDLKEMGDQMSAEIEEMGDQITDELHAQTEAQKGFFQQLGDRITGGLEALGNKLLDGIKALFIPEEGFFEEYFAQWDTWMEEHFGALYYPIDLTIEILNRFLNLEVPEVSTITFPEIRVGEHLLLEAQEYTFLGDDSLPAIKSLYQMYRTVVIVVFVFGLAGLAWKKLNAILGGGE